MEVKVEEHVIPEQIVQIKRYIAFDGLEFDDEDSCLRYEERTKKYLELCKHPVYKYRQRTTLWPEDRPASLVYLDSKEDYQFLTEHFCKGTWEQDDFESCGPGYYLYFTIDGGDSADDYYLYNVEKYQKRIETEYESWSDELTELILNTELKRLEDRNLSN